MNLINLSDELINLDNVSHIQRIRPGHKDWISTNTVTVDSHQIRFYFGSEDYTCIAYGKQESQWRNDWHWLNSFAVDRIAAPQRSPDGGNQ